MNRQSMKSPLTLLLTVISALSFLAVTSPTQASSNLGDNISITYVKVKRPIFTGQYTKVDSHRGKRILTPKGTILKVLLTSGNTAVLSRGLMSYKAQQHLYENKMASYHTKHYNTKYFAPYRFKLPVRARVMQVGSGYTNQAASNYKPIFYITMDGYLQYYSGARLKHYDIKNSFESKSGSQDENPLWRIKPTTMVKINHFKTTGNTSYVYYKKPIKGLPDRKVSSRYYRLSIRKIKNQQRTWRNGDSALTAWWTQYNVGGHAFYDLIEMEADS